jgi:hypothetical protein
MRLAAGAEQDPGLTSTCVAIAFVGAAPIVAGKLREGEFTMNAPRNPEGA